VRDGCTAERVGGAGDLGADVKGKLPRHRWLRPRRRYVQQYKHYGPGHKVPSGDVQKVGGTARQIHGADEVMVITNSYFTRAALDYCKRLHIRTCDRDQLAAWASGTGPPPWL
jgi:restriction system protein